MYSSQPPLPVEWVGISGFCSDVGGIVFRQGTLAPVDTGIDICSRLGSIAGGIQSQSYCPIPSCLFILVVRLTIIDPTP